jgi:hypothetical protein
MESLVPSINNEDIKKMLAVSLCSDTEKLKLAEQFFECGLKDDNFVYTLFLTATDPNEESKYRFCAALHIKNFVKRHWDSTRPLAYKIKDLILTFVHNVSTEKERDLLIDIIDYICIKDFPFKWTTYLQQCITYINQAQDRDRDISYVYFRLIHQALKKYRSMFDQKITTSKPHV